MTDIKKLLKYVPPIHHPFFLHLECGLQIGVRQNNFMEEDEMLSESESDDELFCKITETDSVPLVSVSGGLANEQVHISQLKSAACAVTKSLKRKRQLQTLPSVPAGVPKRRFQKSPLKLVVTRHLTASLTRKRYVRKAKKIYSIQ